MQKKYKYFKFNLRSHSYTGLYEGLDIGYRICNYLNCKKIICFPLINNHKGHKIKYIFGKRLILNILKNLSFSEKILSIFYSLILNFNLLLKKFKIIGLLNLILGKKFVSNFFPLHFGYDEDEEYFKTDKETWEKINESKGFFKVKLEDQKFNKKYLDFLKDKFICLHIKDENYNQITQISNHSISDIENHKKAINYLLDNNYKMIRIGDHLSKKFDFHDKRFLDLTSGHNLTHFNQAYVFQKSEFFFGNITPGVHMCKLFDKNFAISNCPHEYLLYNAFSNSNKNIASFKAIYSVEKKRLLTIPEIFMDEELLFTVHLNKKKFIAIENSPDEIFELSNIFINKNILGKFEINNLFEEFNHLRKKTLDKLMVNKALINNRTTNVRLYSCKQNYFSKVHIPNRYLEQNLVFSEVLKEKSKKITKELNL